MVIIENVQVIIENCSNQRECEVIIGNVQGNHKECAGYHRECSGYLRERTDYYRECVVIIENVLVIIEKLW